MIEWLNSLTKKELIEGSGVDGTPNLLKVFELHQKYFGGTCQNCPSKVFGYIKNLRTLTPEIMAEKAKQEYKLREGVTCFHKKTRTTYSSHNLTDAVAKELLKENPNRKALFSKIPQEKKEVKKPVKKAPKEAPKK